MESQSRIDLKGLEAENRHLKDTLAVLREELERLAEKNEQITGALRNSKNELCHLKKTVEELRLQLENKELEKTIAIGELRN